MCSLFSDYLPSSSAGVCHTAAAHGDTHDDAQLLLHHTEPAGPGHAAVPRLHPSVLALSRPRSPTRRPPVTPRPPRPPQQPPRPLVGHTVILHLIERADATAAAAAAAAAAATAAATEVSTGGSVVTCPLPLSFKIRPSLKSQLSDFPFTSKSGCAMSVWNFFCQ